MSETSYQTVEKEGKGEYTEKRSVFIGYCKPVQTEEAAVGFIEKIKAKHWDARHNVYAYSLRQGQTKRYSDDGEPQGTAGVPILDMIQKSNLTDVVIVVTRYFGGILLGTGGLVRAYSTSAKNAIEQANIVTMEKCSVCTLRCSYNQYGKIAALIPQTGGIVDNSDFHTDVDIDFHIPSDLLETLTKKLADSTGGEVVPTEKFSDFYLIR